MANFLSLQQRVAARGRLDLTQGNFQTLVQQFINEAQKEIWEAKDWYFAIDRQIVQTVIDVTAGTVAVSAGSSTVTGTGTAFGSGMVGYFIQLSSSNDWYQITAVASATSLTIEVPYVGTTSLTAGTYIIRKMLYSVGSTVDKILTARQAVSPSFLDMVNFRDFDVNRPNPLAMADGPRMIVVYGIDSSGYLRFTPYPWPQQVENIELRFKKRCTDMVSNTDASLIPDKWNETVLIEGAYYRVCQFQDDGSQPASHQRYVTAKQVFESMLSRMKSAENPDVSYHPVIQSRDKVNAAIGPILPFKYGES